MNKKEIFNDISIVKPKSFSDERGSFEESYNTKEFHEFGILEEFIQDNISFSLHKGTLRGLHFQMGDFSQSKLLRVLEGEIQDVFVDLRSNSSNFEKFHSVNLNKDSGWIYIPKGYAHGFCTLTDNVSVMYKVDKIYSPEHDSGIRWNDDFFNIEWNLEGRKPILSVKDNTLPLWNDIKKKVNFTNG